MLKICLNKLIYYNFLTLDINYEYHIKILQIIFVLRISKYFQQAIIKQYNNKFLPKQSLNNKRKLIIFLIN